MLAHKLLYSHELHYTEQVIKKNVLRHSLLVFSIEISQPKQFYGKL